MIRRAAPFFVLITTWQSVRTLPSGEENRRVRSMQLQATRTNNYYFLFGLAGITCTSPFGTEHAQLARFIEGTRQLIVVFPSAKGGFSRTRLLYGKRQSKITSVHTNTLVLNGLLCVRVPRPLWCFPVSVRCPLSTSIDLPFVHCRYDGQGLAVIVPLPGRLPRCLLPGTSVCVLGKCVEAFLT